MERDSGMVLLHLSSIERLIDYEASICLSLGQVFTPSHGWHGYEGCGLVGTPFEHRIPTSWSSPERGHSGRRLGSPWLTLLVLKTSFGGRPICGLLRHPFLLEGERKRAMGVAPEPLVDLESQFKG